MTNDLRRSLLFPALLSAFAIVAACTSSGGAASPSAAAPSVEASPSAEASEAPSESAAASEEPSASAAAVELKLGESSLGQIITDGAGKTLYMFQPDEAGTPTCYDDCATAWPPLLADDPASVTVGTGLDASKLTVVPRTDGGSQLKYGTWTLYYFANDAAAGDTNGQGLNDVWWVIGADGEPIKS